MKTRLLSLVCLIAILSVKAQTTHNLNWFTGIGSTVDLTIDVGDTVIWTWTDALPHTVENDAVNFVEAFDSGVLTGNGETFSFTFNVEGANDYLCGIHGAISMSGTITVQNNLSIDDVEISSFKILHNPVSETLNLEIPQNIQNGLVTIHDILGKKVQSQDFNNEIRIILDVSSFSNGLYLVTVESDGIKQTQRFLKE